MVIIGQRRYPLNLKVVYFGPPGSGKRTMIETVRTLADGEIGPITRIDGPEEGMGTTVLTEISNVDPLLKKSVRDGNFTGRVNTRLHCLTGPTRYRASYKLLLQGADSIVFVVDSTSDHRPESLALLRIMEESLEEQGLNPFQVPLVFCWNKRDHPSVVPVAELEEALNPRGLPSFETIGLKRDGVVGSLGALTAYRTARSMALERASRSLVRTD